MDVRLVESLFVSRGFSKAQSHLLTKVKALLEKFGAGSHQDPDVQLTIVHAVFIEIKFGHLGFDLGPPNCFFLSSFVIVTITNEFLQARRVFSCQIPMVWGIMLVREKTFHVLQLKPLRKGG